MSEHKTKILVLCTGNSCRSQMAEGILKSFDSTLEVHSAGTNPASYVHPMAINVMDEIGIDLSKAYPKNVRMFLEQPFDYVLTVCDHANETCPIFTGQVLHKVHIGFDDPAMTEGTETERLEDFRRVRDEIKQRLFEWYMKDVKK